MSGKYRFFSAVLGLAFASLANGQKPAAWLGTSVESIETIISKEMARLNTPALSIAIATGNEIRYADGFGLSDLENSVPAKTTTVYRTASIAKAMTAVGVLQLAEGGILDMDAPVQRYCASFPQKRWIITSRHLLGHLGGIRHYRGPQEASGTTHYDAVGQGLKLFKDDPLLYEPGTKFNYTTYGYCLLGSVLEGASGMAYDQYMREHIFQPAQMYHTEADNSRK